MKTYQKGEAVIFSALVRDRQGKLVTTETAKLTVIDATGEISLNAAIMQPVVGGAYEKAWLIPIDAVPGYYTVSISIGTGEETTIQRDGFRVVA